MFRGPDGGVAGTATEASGAFAMRWSPSLSGNYAVRAFGVHDAHSRGSASKARRLTTHHPAGASYYGPGQYGNSVACGGTLMPGTMGVANKTLPCGTEVKLRYHGHTVTVPVIDRGPYVAGRAIDLSTATRLALECPDLCTLRMQILR